MAVASKVVHTGCAVTPNLWDQEDDRYNEIQGVVNKMDDQNKEEIKIEDFDKLFVRDLVEAEKNLRALLPQAKSLEDKSIYIQILSQNEQKEFRVEGKLI